MMQRPNVMVTIWRRHTVRTWVEHWLGHEHRRIHYFGPAGGHFGRIQILGLVAPSELAALWAYRAPRAIQDSSRCISPIGDSRRHGAYLLTGRLLGPNEGVLLVGVVFADFALTGFNVAGVVDEKPVAPRIWSARQREVPPSARYRSRPVHRRDGRVVIYGPPASIHMSLAVSASRRERDQTDVLDAGLLGDCGRRYASNRHHQDRDRGTHCSLRAVGDGTLDNCPLGTW